MYHPYFQFTNASVVPPTPSTPASSSGGGGHGWTRKRTDWRDDKSDIRQRLEIAIIGLEAVPTLAPEVAEIKREHAQPHAKKKQAPRMDWDSLLADTDAVNWLLARYERVLAAKKAAEDEDDDEVFILMVH